MIAEDDPRRPDVRALLARHLEFALAQTPPEHSFALDVDGLLDPAVTFFSYRDGGALLGVGALKELNSRHGEIKSMHTTLEARGRGIGRAMLSHLLSVARGRGLRQVSLETGTKVAFAPARALYARAGFVQCGPFADYRPSEDNYYMTLELEGNNTDLYRFFVACRPVDSWAVSPTALGSRYLLDEPIGRGGMGVVWRGRDRATDAVYAIKVLRPEIADDPSAVGRFVRERTALVKFRHPNVVTVHDMIVEGDRLALVMNLVAGGNLEQLRRDRGGQLEQDEAIRLIAQVAAGLAAAHTAGIVHRDLKPANMLVSWDDETPQVQLADFGIARLAGQARDTTEGSVLGTAAYLAPEVIQGEEPGSESDVYALGIALYELLAGHPPFTGAVGAILHAHVSTAPERIAGVRGDLWSLIQNCLAKDPRSRPSAAQVSETLDRLASGQGAPSRPRRLRLVRPSEEPPSQQPAEESPAPLAEPVPAGPLAALPADPRPAKQLPRQEGFTSVLPATRHRSVWWPALAVGGAALIAAAVTGLVLLVWPANGSQASNQASSGDTTRQTTAPHGAGVPSPASTPPARPLYWRCGPTSRQPGGIMYARACVAIQGKTVHIKGYLWRVPFDLSAGDSEQLHIVLVTPAGHPVAQYTSPTCHPGRCTYAATATVPAGAYHARADFFFDEQKEFQSRLTPYITVP